MQKKRGTDALHGRSPARYYEKKCYFTNLPTMILPSTAARNM